LDTLIIRIITAGIVSLLDSVSKVHLLLHRLNSALGWISDAKDGKVIVWIILGLILLLLAEGVSFAVPLDTSIVLLSFTQVISKVDLHLS
jgi:hypothetical protein